MFPIIAIFITVLSLGHNEGGFKAINDKGYEKAFEQAIEESVPLKADKYGNYGND